LQDIFELVVLRSGNGVPGRAGPVAVLQMRFPPKLTSFGTVPARGGLVFKAHRLLYQSA